MRPELSLLVPAYNDRENLRAHLPVMAEQARACTPRYEILVVDDGSQDGTSEWVRARAARDRRVRLVRHAHNQGPGAGIPTGLFWARGDWVMFLPADLACEPEDIGRLWQRRQGADVVVGLRDRRGDCGPWRRLLSAGFVGLVRALSGTGLRQLTYIQLYRRRVFERLRVRSRGVFVTAEIALRAQARGLRVAELPMGYRPRRFGRAAGARPSAVLRCAYELTRFFAFEREMRSCVD